MTDPVARKGLLLKADSIAATFRDEVKQSLEQCRIRPKLVGILATSSAPSKNYAEYTKKQCDELGVEFTLIQTGAAVSLDLSEGYGVEEAIIEANEDNSVHGIMVKHPFFLQIYSLTYLVSRFTSQFLEYSRYLIEFRSTLGDELTVKF
jgi:methylenetetrahydrofolate dehydrogenase (NAD+)